MAAAAVAAAVVNMSVTFAGEGPVYHAMPISPGAVSPRGAFAQQGGWLNTTFKIPAAISDQLAQRQKDYPIKWEESDYRATWLVQTRLLMYPFLAPVADDLPLYLEIDGVPVPLSKSYNSRGLVRPRCFLGYYFDASDLSSGETHTMSLQLPKLGTSTKFQGVFWENVETVRTNEVEACFVESPPSVTSKSML
jgi:hypothetical protein